MTSIFKDFIALKHFGVFGLAESDETRRLCTKLFDLVKKTAYVVEFGNTLDYLFENDMDAVELARAESHRLRIDNQFHFPFPACVITYSEINRSGRPAQHLALVVETPESKDSMADIFVFSSGIEGWAMYPLVQVRRSIDADLMVHFTEQRSEAVQKVILDFTTVLAGNVMLASTLLAQPGSLSDIITPTKASNALRRARKLPALPTINRVVHLARYATAPAQKATGALGCVKSPHDRRSHTRTCKSGKVIQVSACQIRGGARVQKILRVAP